MISVRGTFQNGVAQPTEAVTDREGQAVIITFVDDAATKSASKKSASNDPSNGDENSADWDRLISSIE
ncbi:MAG: hypothetical protein AAFO83_16615, partial [Cyanobacteria bacterium J06607_13]